MNGLSLVPRDAANLCLEGIRLVLFELRLVLASRLTVVYGPVALGRDDIAEIVFLPHCCNIRVIVCVIIVHC